MTAPVWFSVAAGLCAAWVILPSAAGAGEPQPEPQTFDSGGVPIRYTVEGHGEPVILIHGLHASAQMNWRGPGIIKELLPDYQVIAMDVRGHGGSGKPDEETAYGVEMMEDVIRLMDHLHIKKAHVVGYSMGGMITLKLLTRHPDRVLSATLGGMGWLREGSRLQKSWSQLPDRRGAFSTPPACVRSLGALAVTETELKAVKVPVAVVIGERDPVRNLYVAPLELARPDWPVKTVPNAGHINCIFQPAFKKEIKTWLDAQPKAAAKPPGS